MNNLDKFDHVVVLMLENRSFDNLLGFLYDETKAGGKPVPKGKSYAGLQGTSFSNPVPPRFQEKGGHPNAVSVAISADYHQPFPDPGEEYPHINTQLFNHIDRQNIKVPGDQMTTPYNLPNPVPPVPKMNGFVNDYINTLQAMKESEYQDPTLEQYEVIMQCFEPQQVNVLSTLAREFAVFDHWHCSVPSQTWCNRAFWHAATSGGKVINPIGEGHMISNFSSWIKNVWTKENLFGLLNKNGISSTVYTANPFSLTSLINGIDKVGTIKHDVFGSGIEKFTHDLNNNNLPQYSFIEPKFILQHNDQHPSSVSGVLDGPTKDGTVILGEKFIWDVYYAIKNSDYWDKTLFIITYDENGGCFDHVPPPSCVAPGRDSNSQENFNFNRLGVRVPMVMISPYISKNTIINETFDHSSFIKTMSDKWNLGNLTNRDKNASSFSAVFSDKKRSSYPEIPEPVLTHGIDNGKAYANDPLNGLQKSIIAGAIEIAKNNALTKDIVALKKSVEEIPTVEDAMEYLTKVKDLLF